MRLENVSTDVLAVSESISSQLYSFRVMCRSSSTLQATVGIAVEKKAFRVLELCRHDVVASLPLCPSARSFRPNSRTRAFDFSEAVSRQSWTSHANSEKRFSMTSHRLSSSVLLLQQKCTAYRRVHRWTFTRPRRLLLSQGNNKTAESIPTVFKFEIHEACEHSTPTYNTSS